jgi:prepilin-type N-terminal cleavage/methylation domain-containing protein
MKSGFTLMETLVAITILLIGVLGPLTIAARGIADGLYAKNQLVANFLAQEALELIINQRDTNLDWIDNNLGSLDNWDYAIRECYTQPCRVSPQATGQSGDPMVYQGSAESLVYCAGSGLYVESGSGSCSLEDERGPIFTRAITIDDLGVTPPQIKVTITMSWFNRSVPKDFTLVNYLYQCLATTSC